MTTGCEFVGCEEKHWAKGWCKFHYGQHSSGRKMTLTRHVVGSKKCSFEGCIRKHHSKGWCTGHYKQCADGLVLQPITRKFTQRAGGHAGWRLDPAGYVVRSVSIDGAPRLELQHRLVVEEHMGRTLLKHENVHHLNGNRADNRIENLELWSTSQPPGQRVVDKLDWARGIIALYGPDEDELRKMRDSHG